MAVDQNSGFFAAGGADASLGLWEGRMFWEGNGDTVAALISMGLDSDSAGASLTATTFTPVSLWLWGRALSATTSSGIAGDQLSMHQSGFHHFSQSREGGKIALIKGARLAGKELEDSQHPVFADDGHHDHGSDAQVAADIAVHPGIAFGVIAAQKLAGANAFAGEPIFGGEQRAELGSLGAAAGPAQHVVVGTTAQGDRDATGPGDVLGTLGEQLQRGVEIGVSHLGQGATTVLCREAGPVFRKLRRERVSRGDAGRNARKSACGDGHVSPHRRR